MDQTLVISLKKINACYNKSTKMKVAIITDSIEIGPISVGNYTRNLIKELLSLEGQNIDLVLIHSNNSNDDIYNAVRNIVVPYPEAKKHNNIVAKLLYFFVNNFNLFLRGLKIRK